MVVNDNLKFCVSNFQNQVIEGSTWIDQFLRMQETFGVGFVIKNDKGKLTVAIAKPCRKLCSPLTVELMAIKEASLSFRYSGFSEGNIINDSKMLMVIL